MIKLKKPNVIFFDLDDTLTAFDSIGPHAWEQVCGQFVVKHNVNFTKEELIQSINRIKVEYWKDPIKHKWGREHLRQARREVACLSLKALGCMSKSLGNMLGDEYTSLQDSMIHIPHEALHISPSIDGQ